MKVSVLVLASLFLTISCAFSDSVTLNDGELIQCEIVSEIDTQIVIDVSNSNNTITIRRFISKSDVKTVQRESEQQKQERQAYAALAPLRLDPNREFSKTEYERGIEAFNKFLAVYPKSKFVDDIRQRIALWKTELSHIENGEAKFDNQWMTPDEKKPFMDRFLKQQQVQTATDTLQSLRDKLDHLEYQRQKLLGPIAQSEQSAKNAQAVIANPPKIMIPIYKVIPGSPAVPSHDYYANGARHTGGGRNASASYEVKVGDQPVDDPAVVKKTQADLAFYQNQVNQVRQQLAVWDNSINNTKQKIAQAESENRIAIAKLQKLPPPSKPKPVQVAQPVSPQPVASVSPQPTPAMPEPKPWIVRNWKGLAIGGGILLILLILAYSLNRMATRAQAEQEPQHRAAREQLRKLFDRIMIEGKRPVGKNTPDGEIVPIGKGQDASGGGRWFVIGHDYVWAVQNNGKEEDNWTLNNVKTGGPGAIGARVPVEAELAGSIKALAKATR